MKPIELLEQGRFLGEEFLLWLWMRSQTDSGGSGEEGDGSACFVDDSIQLVSERGEVKEISLRKGSPSESREAFEALSRGMRPARMKLRILSGDMEWVFTLNAATLDMGTLKLPPSTGKAPHERLHDRLFLLEEGAGHLEHRLSRFLRARSEDPGGMEEALRAWVRAGLSGAGGDTPWEA
jgi:recombination associated protein RdgC